MLKFMYITNQPEIARIAEASGVDRIFVDLESLGKAERQGGMDTVQSHHSFQDIANVRQAVTKSKLLVRCNPIHPPCPGYCGSEEEIETILKNGADILMLPYFKTPEEVSRFIDMVGGRAKTDLLVETPEAVAAIDEILAIPGIDEVHIGLNDLSLGYGKKFMFELMTDGTVEMLCRKFREAGIPYGIGGIASLGRGMLPAEYLIREHFRLGSTAAILSRSFCNANRIADLKVIRRIFRSGLWDIREFEQECLHLSAEELLKNKRELDRIVASIARG